MRPTDELCGCCPNFIRDERPKDDAGRPLGPLPNVGTCDGGPPTAIITPTPSGQTMNSGYRPRVDAAYSCGCHPTRLLRERGIGHGLKNAPAPATPALTDADADDIAKFERQRALLQAVRAAAQARPEPAAPTSTPKAAPRAHKRGKGRF